jgi:hypothetical protein
MSSQAGGQSTRCGGNPEVPRIGENDFVAMDVRKAKKLGLSDGRANKEQRGEKPKKDNPRF